MCRENLGIIGLAALLAAGSLPLLTSVAYSGQVDYQFNDPFSGTAPASTNQPWIDAMFEDVTPGTVQLTVANLNLSGSENVGGLYLNLNPTYDPTALRLSFLGGSGGFATPLVSLGQNAFKADGDGKYDVLFSFDEGGTDATRFTAGEYMVCQISGIPNLSAADFACQSLPAGGIGPFYAAAHVQRIGDGALSGWVSATVVMDSSLIPEPGSGTLLGLASAAGIVFSVIRRRRPVVQRMTRTRF